MGLESDFPASQVPPLQEPRGKLGTVRRSHPNLAVHRMIRLFLPKPTHLIEIKVFHLVSWEWPNFEERRWVALDGLSTAAAVLKTILWLFSGMPSAVFPGSGQTHHRKAAHCEQQRESSTEPRSEAKRLLLPKALLCLSTPYLNGMEMSALQLLIFLINQFRCLSPHLS